MLYHFSAILIHFVLTQNCYERENESCAAIIARYADSIDFYRNVDYNKIRISLSNDIRRRSRGNENKITCK
jgi:hypothetical protein